jgi:prepilin signal peptidase PulO-like enzyme (type II secretory pathway)
MAKVKYVLLLPLTYNDKSKVPKSVKDQILDELFLLAAGYHIAGVGKGAYRMKSGQKQIDYSLEIWLAVEEDDVPALRQMVARFGAMLGQEAMYLERTGGTVEFIPALAVGG